MELPFTVEQFLAVFVRYNTAVWPMQILLNLVAVGLILAVLRRRPWSRLVAVSLGILWIWTGVVYHLTFFSAINPAARGFGILFLVQGLVFLTVGLLGRGVDFSFGKHWTYHLGTVVIVYGLLLYPVLGALGGHGYPAGPTFGAPCPLVIFTCGLLLWTRKLTWYLVTIPVLWSVIGFSAALMLGISEDIGLLVSSLCLVVGMIVRRNIYTQALRNASMENEGREGVS